jgi:hypothetical protein
MYIAPLYMSRKKVLYLLGVFACKDLKAQKKRCSVLSSVGLAIFYREIMDEAPKTKIFLSASFTSVSR